MIFKKYTTKKILKKEDSYLSHQQELESYRRLGITEYVFWGSGCDICTSLNGKVFLVTAAKVGVNLPPMHPKCRCTIVPKSKIDLFKDRGGANPLKDNPKFEEWKRKYKDSI